MTSREIAELTGKEHRNVMRDIADMLTSLDQDVLSFEQMSRDSYGRPQRIYALPKRETLILVSGYSVTMRAKIIDRWQELEAQAAPSVPAVPTTLVEALRLALTQAEALKVPACLMPRLRGPWA